MSDRMIAPTMEHDHIKVAFSHLLAQSRKFKMSCLISNFYRGENILIRIQSTTSPQMK